MGQCRSLQALQADIQNRYELRYVAYITIMVEPTKLGKDDLSNEDLENLIDGQGRKFYTNWS